MKKLLAILLALSMLVAFAACGSKSEPETTKDKQQYYADIIMADGFVAVPDTYFTVEIETGIIYTVQTEIINGHRKFAPAAVVLNIDGSVRTMSHAEVDEVINAQVLHMMEYNARYVDNQTEYTMTLFAKEL